MPLKVVRDRFTSYSTEGRLYLDTFFQCFTLEPRRSREFGKPFCIPEGIYLYEVRRSQHFQRDVICIDLVPGFTSIEVHPGNFPKDTHGCTLVGITQGEDFIGHSEEAFDRLLQRIVPRGTIQYVNEG